MNDSERTFTITDLKNWRAISEQFDVPALLSVFGNPVEHSLSPQLHNPALKFCDIKSQYVKIKVQEDEFQEALNLIKDNGFHGTNCTVPLKFAAISACDSVDESARRMGAVNTIRFENGKALGSNSDGPGLVRAIREEFSIDLSDLRVMILGAGGGAGRAVAIQCAIEKVERLVLVNRTEKKVRPVYDEVAKDLKETHIHASPSRLKMTGLSKPELEEELGDIDLIINASSLGMKNSDPELIPAGLLQPHHLVYDMVYSPRKTKLIRNALSTGARSANGISMLLHQGAISFETWFNREAPINEMRKGLYDALNN
ncbi:MAG: shikimate dehydrogenase [Verrucomicrobiota bacterium]|nr:shikimate dehydrogenase [Verrucomicrobiota bacterium]MEE2967799.1 shikimate dehydrogenase [Verrucomicrobiota bacterium]